MYILEGFGYRVVYLEIKLIRVGVGVGFMVFFLVYFILFCFI